MSVVNDKVNLLRKNITTLNEYKYDLEFDNYDAIMCIAEDIVKLAYFLKSYRDLDVERERDVKETVIAFLNRNDMYDKPFMDCIEHCFGEYD